MSKFDWILGLPRQVGHTTAALGAEDIPHVTIVPTQRQARDLSRQSGKNVRSLETGWQIPFCCMPVVFDTSAVQEIVRELTNVRNFRALQADIHATARSKGFYDSPTTIGERIALVHSELSELLECHREGREREPCDKGALPITQEAEEMADVVIRMMDMAQHLGVDLWAAIQAKHEYNTTRPHMHGGKKF